MHGCLMAMDPRLRGDDEYVWVIKKAKKENDMKKILFIRFRLLGFAGLTLFIDRKSVV